MINQPPERHYKVVIKLNPLMKALFDKDDVLRYLADLYLAEVSDKRLPNVVVPHPEYRKSLADDLYKQITSDPGASHFIQELGKIYLQGYVFDRCSNVERVYDFIFVAPRGN